MRYGLVPITTYETGLDYGSYGIKIEKTDITHLKRIILTAKNMNKDEYNKRYIETKKASMLYTEDMFKNKFRKAILKTINNNKNLQMRCNT